MEKENLKEIYLAGGCFWGTEHYFKQIDGVVDTEVGYANGTTENPTYKDVCTDKTGFAETVHVTYNPDKVSLKFLLEMFTVFSVNSKPLLRIAPEFTQGEVMTPLT